RKRNRTEGYVIGCDGTYANVVADVHKDNGASDDYWTVGQLISIRCGNVRVVGMLAESTVEAGAWDNDGVNRLHMSVALIGEVIENDGKPKFSGGLSAYPHPGAVAHRVRMDDLRAIFASSDPSAVRIGALSQSRDIDAMISIDTMVERHFAVVGTTGAGKSTSVSLLVRDIVKVQPETTVLILDPHNEYGEVFKDVAHEVNEHNLDLPFWLFRLEEFVEVLYRGRKPIAEEVDILRDLIPLAKAKFKGDGDSGLIRKKERAGSQITCDTPIPYRLSDLTDLIDERLGQLDRRDERFELKSLLNRISSSVSDPRYRFMFANRTIADNMVDVLSSIYRIPTNGKPVTTFQLNGIPSEVVNAVVSVLCRVAFDLGVWSNGKFRTVILCEEAHRYIPANREENFGPTRAAIARIAKEGRKYGVTMGLVTQRPSELDPTILSQCSTIFAMRLGNEQDQEIMRKSISGASRSYINFLSSLANREAISFGQGVSTPMRMIFREALPHELPGKFDQEGEDDSSTSTDLASIIDTIRNPKFSSEEQAVGMFGEEVMLADAAPATDFVEGEGAHSGRFQDQAASLATAPHHTPSGPAPGPAQSDDALAVLKERAANRLASRNFGGRGQMQAQTTSAQSQSGSGDKSSTRDLISRFRS
ncbi:MAG: DUF87 domain-containing protein, partial [Pseudomonadota bacterium]